MTYYLPFQRATVEKPTLENITATYGIGLDGVNVTANIRANGCLIGFVDLGQMENTDNWTDEDVINFANLALEKFKVK